MVPSLGPLCTDVRDMKLIHMARSFIFDSVFYIVTAVLSLVCLPLLCGPRSWTVTLSRLWCGWSLWWLKVMVGLRFEVDGSFPKGPFILAAKHESAWETLALTYLTCDPVFILKDALLRIPLFGWYLRKVGMIAVRRSNGAHVIDAMVFQAKRLVQQGRPIIVFPEGTRAAPGQAPPLKGGVWYLHKTLHVPVIPVSLNSGQFWERKAWVKKPGTIHLIIHPPVQGPNHNKHTFLSSLQEAINVQNVS
jgi:1-acyl-sn-glycerol-3-phosphate acyltransferase